MENTLIDNQHSSILLYEESLSVIGLGESILSNHLLVVKKAEDAGRVLLAMIEEAGGMNGELDLLCEQYNKKARLRKRELTDSRSILTKVIDDVRRLFIVQESRLDDKTEDSFPAVIQGKRDTYMRQLVEEAQREEEIRLMAERKRLHLLFLKEEYDKQFLGYFNNFLSCAKKDIGLIITHSTAENWEHNVLFFENISEEYPVEYFEMFKVDWVSEYYSLSELECFSRDFFTLAQERVKKYYEDTISSLKGAVREQLDLIKSSLESGNVKDLVLAGCDYIRDIEEEALSFNKEAAAMVHVEVLSEEENILLESESRRIDTERLIERTKGQCDIEVLDVHAWPLIFQFWYEREGKHLTIEKSFRFSLERMVRFCERHYMKSGERIDSKFLCYSSQVKAKK